MMKKKKLEKNYLELCERYDRLNKGYIHKCDELDILLINNYKFKDKLSNQNDELNILKYELGNLKVRNKKLESEDQEQEIFKLQLALTECRDQKRFLSDENHTLRKDLARANQ